MREICVSGYAKINLFLDIFSKYANGYHGVRTIMQTVSLKDTVRLCMTNSGIGLSCSDPSLPCDEKNTAYRAAACFFEKSGIDSGVRIEIEKNIPVEAGLAGGSADAAATLLGLNEIYGFPLAKEALLSIAQSIGADVPFCVTCGTAFADGKGDEVYELAPMPECYVVIAKGKHGVSTPWAYGELDRIYKNFSDGAYQSASEKKMISAIERKDLYDICKNMRNIFEDVVVPHRPEVMLIKKSLIKNGAVNAMMSGSGTAVFGIFEKKDMAENCSQLLASDGFFSAVTTMIGKRL